VNLFPACGVLVYNDFYRSTEKPINNEYETSENNKLGAQVKFHFYNKLNLFMANSCFAWDQQIYGM